MSLKLIYRRCFLWVWERYKRRYATLKLSWDLVIEIGEITHAWTDWDFQLRTHGTRRLTTYHENGEGLIIDLITAYETIRINDYLPDHFKVLESRSTTHNLGHWLMNAQGFLIEPRSMVGELVKHVKLLANALAAPSVNAEDRVYYQSRLRPLMVEVHNTLTLLLLISTGR